VFQSSDRVQLWSKLKRRVRHWRMLPQANRTESAGARALRSDTTWPTSRAHENARNFVGAHTWQRLFAISALSYLMLIALSLSVSMALNHDTVVYALDDPYIHLAMARNWLRAHSVGVTPGHFAPASSSPLWVVLLVACSALVGLQDTLPLALNMLASLGLLALFWRGREQLRGSALGVDDDQHWSLIAAGLPLLLNLPALSLCGMEHVLHAALVLGFTIGVWRYLQRANLSIYPVYALSAMLPLVRLESVFVIGAAALVLLRHRKPRHAFGLVIVAALPVIAQGVVMHANGGFYLPNPIVAKALPPLFSAWLERWGLELLGLLSHPMLLLVFGWSLVYRRAQTGLAADGFLFCFLIALLHSALSTVGGIGYLDRYESYVVDLGLFFVCASDMQAARHVAALPKSRAQRRWGRLERVLVVLGVLEKGALFITATLATNDIYEQQYQMARLVKQQFPHSGIAVNDLGLVSLRAGGTVTDLVGLGTTEVLRAQRAAGDLTLLDERVIDPILAHNRTDLMIIYTSWFSPRLYAGWQPVAAWSLPRPPITAGGSRVVFFAPDAARARELTRRLHAFEGELPKHVKVQYVGKDWPGASLEQGG
jgi:hypothetical protein